MKKIITGILTGLILISSLSVSAASFTDVKQGDWYYETVTIMSGIGLFEGKGNNMFCPNDTMTRAEFLTVTVRAVFSDTDITAKEGQEWWQPVYWVAVSKGLITQNEYTYSGEVLNAPIPRQEMALILTRACEQMGEGTGVLLSDSRISDYNTVGDYYKIAVKTAYTKGLIAGKDSTGRFDPQGTLTRAEGATVLYRLVNESQRVKVGTDTGTSTPVSSAITIYEGQARYNRNAQEGDLFIKKDGTQIFLKKGPNGILGEGQGVAPDVGLLGTVGENGCDSFTYKVADYGNWYDSTGMHLQNQSYYINNTTGEGYWGGDIKVLTKNISKPDRDGAYEGEVSSDSYRLYVWDSGDWYLNFTW